MILMMPLVGQIAGRVQPKYMIAIGFCIIALAMWYSTTLVPDASFGYFATLRVFQTIGMPFMFIPINMVAYTGLPQQKTAQASALINVARNLGGSVSVSLANTELVQRSQFHQSRLVENLTQSSPSLQSAIHNLTQYFAQFGSPQGAQGRAFGYIGHLIADQAALMGYIDIFYSWAIFSAALVPVVLILIRRIGPVSGAGAAAGH
jgi:DHA2 family multidrug resistance protein